MLAAIAAAFYLLAALWPALRLSRSPRRPPLSAATALLLLALSLHGWLLLRALPADGGYHLGFYAAFSLTSWAVAAMLALLRLSRPAAGPAAALSVVLLPVTAAAVILQSVMPPSAMVVAVDTIGLRLHILLSITAYGALTIAVTQALILRCQHANLHGKRPNLALDILPPMQNMEKFLLQTLACGFFILSLSLATGLMFVRDIFTQHLAHKMVFSVIAWAVFAVVLWGRWARGWRGKTLLRWILGGFVCLALAYFGTKAALDLILQRF